jgi:hypothetical protein
MLELPCGLFCPPDNLAHMHSCGVIMLVIAKGYGDIPLERVVTGTTQRVVYLRNPSARDAKNPPPMSGVGFPRWAVFQHDSALFESMAEAWRAGDQESLSHLWESAQPFIPSIGP